MGSALARRVLDAALQHPAQRHRWDRSARLKTRGAKIVPAGKTKSDKESTDLNVNRTPGVEPDAGAQTDRSEQPRC
jgi:hypothetical protein